MGQRGAAAFGEAVIACAGDFIDQIAIEIDRETHPERQARGHAGRIGLHWLIEIFPELGELLDKGEQPIDRLAIDPGDEPGIVRTGEAALEAVRVADRPRYPHAAADGPVARMLDAGDQPQQSRFAGAVRAANPQRLPGADREAGVMKHVLGELAAVIGLVDAIEGDHAHGPPGLVEMAGVSGPAIRNGAVI